MTNSPHLFASAYKLSGAYEKVFPAKVSKDTVSEGHKELCFSAFGILCSLFPLVTNNSYKGCEIVLKRECPLVT